MTVNTIIKVGISEGYLQLLVVSSHLERLSPLSLHYFTPISQITTELGSGPFSLVSAMTNDTIFGVNRTSNTVIPLVQVRPEQFPPPDILFNFMITMGLQKDRISRECLR